MASTDWTAVVLTGGTSSRFGGTDKTAVDLLDGRTSLDLILADLPTGVAVVVVGPAVPTQRGVLFCREEPEFGGPVAALAAALPLVRTPALVLVAGDQPFAGSLASRLAAELDIFVSEALVPLDAHGRRQPLCAAYSSNAVRRACIAVGSARGASMGRLLAQLRVTDRPLGYDERDAIVDIDTPEDLAAARRLAGGD